MKNLKLKAITMSLAAILAVGSISTYSIGTNNRGNERPNMSGNNFRPQKPNGHPSDMRKGEERPNGGEFNNNSRPSNSENMKQEIKVPNMSGIQNGFMNNQNQGMNQSMNQGGPKEVLDRYVKEGVLTQDEADKLLKYLEENRPNRNTQMSSNSERVDPLSGAVKQGIITQSQADQIKEALRPPHEKQGNQNNQSQRGNRQGFNMVENQQNPNMNNNQLPTDQNQGMQQPNRKSGSTVSSEEANKIEDKLLKEAGYTSKVGGYPIVDTGVTTYYNNSGSISKPSETSSFYGQDATYQGNKASYKDNGDGTITDNVTGLMWQKDPGEKMTWSEAVEKLETFKLAGYDDWRLPTIKELYSLVQFTGVTGSSSSDSIPYIDTNYFEFEYGDAAGESRFIDSQMATSTIYDSSTMSGNTTMFGYNFADGRIKGYPIDKDFYVYFVRGNTSYGQNQFVDNGDGTITDLATGLMWMTYDSGYYKAGENKDGTMDWEDALKWCEDLNLAGYDDWKLPDAKELQSIVDYTKSPDTTNSAAIDEKFYSTEINNYVGQKDYGFYWTSTTHLDGRKPGENGVYIAFGRGMGSMNGKDVDVHGAGCQRSDPKTGGREDYPSAFSHAPQGDERRVFNMVRAVRVVK